MEEICKYFVGVKFDGTSKAYYFSTNLGDLKVGDQVIVETISGLELGILTTALMPTAAYTSTLDLKPILRRPTKEDLEDYNLGLKEASMAMEITRREVNNLHLPMNLISANYTLDGSRVTITYTSESRVDFRELLRVLAPQLKCRIELRQIASRDKAKLVGGLGICGLPLCCTTFLNQFDGISISRAKNQMLTLNIPKLSGACGKLICCLLYEDDFTPRRKRTSRGLEPSSTIMASITPWKPITSSPARSNSRMPKAISSFLSMTTTRWLGEAIMALQRVRLAPVARPHNED
ncbi:MAG: signal peptidase II [Bacteroidales bacterium]|nr:signal peptidase II [Bacteroidales bacterium]